MVLTQAQDLLTQAAAAQKPSRVPGETHPGVLLTKECMDANIVVDSITHQVRAWCLSFSM